MKLVNGITGKTICFLILAAVLVASAIGFGGLVAHDWNEKTTAANTTQASTQKPSTSETTSAEQTENNTTAKTTSTSASEAITSTKPTQATQPNSTKPTEQHSTTHAPREDLPKTTDKLVCFTFDDGPYAPVTNKILDTLEKYNAKATFFVVGDRVKTYQKQIKRAQAMGCEIGTHTYSHVNLTKLTVPEMQEELKKSCTVISSVTGEEVKILRPPEGATNDTVKANVGMPMVLWSVDSMDWYHRNAEKDYQNVMDNVFDGSIVLMHDLYPATADAVAKLIPKLAAEGYKFVTFSELMEIRGIEVKPGEKYFSAKPQIPSVSAEEN